MILFWGQRHLVWPNRLRKSENKIFLLSGLLRSVGWLSTDVSGQLIGPIFNGNFKVWAFIYRVQNVFCIMSVRTYDFPKVYSQLVNGIYKVCCVIHRLYSLRVICANFLPQMPNHDLGFICPLRTTETLPSVVYGVLGDTGTGFYPVTSTLLSVSFHQHPSLILTLIVFLL